MKDNQTQNLKAIQTQNLKIRRFKNQIDTNLKQFLKIELKLPNECKSIEPSKLKNVKQNINGIRKKPLF